MIFIIKLPVNMSWKGDNDSIPPKCPYFDDKSLESLIFDERR